MFLIFSPLTVEAVLNSQLNRKQLNYLGQNALHVAAKMNKTDIIEMLFNYQLLCLQDVNGMHPYHYAALQGNIEVFKALMKTEKVDSIEI